MKTPWRFVADLVSRKPSAEPPRVHRENPSDVKALDYNPASEELLTDASAHVVEQVTENAPAAEIDLSATTAVNAETVTDAAGARTETGEAKAPAAVTPVEPTEPLANREPALSIAETSSSQHPAAPAPQRAKKPKEVPGLEPLAADAVVQGPVAPNGPKTVAAEMAELNAEIDALRRELAMKLSAQNEQLRTLLARYEAR